MDASLEAQRVRGEPPVEPETGPHRTPFCASSLEAQRVRGEPPIEPETDPHRAPFCDGSLEAQRVRGEPPIEPETGPHRAPFCARSLEETRHTIRKVFIESLHLNMLEAELPYEQKLDEVVGLDSIAIIEFVAAVEKQFGVTLEPEVLNLEFVRDLPALAAHVDALRRGQ